MSQNRHLQDQNNGTKNCRLNPEAAELCGVGKSTIYRLIDKGKIKRRKLGKRALILVSDIEAYMSSLEEG